MIDIVVFDKNSGLIKRLVSCREEAVDIQIQDGEDYINGTVEDDGLKCINTITKEVEDKIEVPYQINKTEIISDGVDEVQITDIPSNSYLRFHGIRKALYEINDGSFEFTIDEVGEYKIIITNDLYLDTIITITTTEV